MAKKRWGTGAMIGAAALIAIALIVTLVVVIPAITGEPLLPGTPPATTTTTNGVPVAGVGDLTITAKWDYNSTTVTTLSAGAVTMFMIPASEVQSSIDAMNKKPADIGQGSIIVSDSISAGNSLYSYEVACLIQQYADTGKITRGVEGPNGESVGSAYDTASITTAGLFVFTDVYMTVDEWYYFIAFEDQTFADGEILPAVLYTKCTQVMATEDEDENRVGNSKILFWVGGDVDYFNLGTARTAYTDCETSDSADQSLTLNLRCDTAGDRMENICLYRMVPDSNATSFDWFKLGGSEISFIKVSSLDTDDPRYDARPTALSSNTTYVADEGFATYYLSSSDKGKVEFEFQYDWDDAAVNQSHYFYLEGMCLGEDTHLATTLGSFVLEITYSGTDAWT